MKKIIELLEKLNLPFAIDKQLHFIVGFLIAFVFTIITSDVTAGIFFTLIFSYIKEFRDEFVYGGFDWKDVYATFLGGVVFSIIYIII